MYRIRGQKKAVLETPSEVLAIAGKGLLGDHYSGELGKRSVTLIQQGHLNNVSNILDKKISPQDSRRSIVVERINLNALTNQEFSIGEKVILKGTGDCHPCSRMETNIGYGRIQCFARTWRNNRLYSMWRNDQDWR